MKKFLNKNQLYIVIFISCLAIVGLLIINKEQSINESSTSENIETPSKFINSDLNTNFGKTSVDLNQILSGGPGKDGIPALTNPIFESLAMTSINDSVQVIYVEHNGEGKLYPYNIMVWHEIVNDSVGGKSLAITYCPLCGSAIVFERSIDNQVIDFGVSGYLYESNMIMYSRERSESLFSQSLGEAIVGERLGATLKHYPLELTSLGEAKSKYPNAKILSTSTGFNRNYDSGNPYAGYEDSEDTIFQVSVTDKRFPAKEIFYIVPIEGKSVAVRLDKENGEYAVPDSDIVVTINNGNISANWGDAEIPGYYEMWFSWATHNSESGIVLD